jgi:hypothetical protein
MSLEHTNVVGNWGRVKEILRPSLPGSSQLDLLGAAQRVMP